MQKMFNFLLFFCSGEPIQRTMADIVVDDGHCKHCHQSLARDSDSIFVWEGFEFCSERCLGT